MDPASRTSSGAHLPGPVVLDPHEKRRVALGAGFALLWSIFTLLAQFSGVLDELEEPLIDWRLSLHAYPAPPSNQLALIAIDTIPDDRPWPWSRLDYSLVLRSLIDYAPKSVVFEMNLNDRDTTYTSFDDTFSHIVERANAVVFASTAMTAPEATAPPENLDVLTYHGDAHFVPSFNSALWPLKTFAGNSPIGVNNVQSESGLRVRSLPLVFLLHEKMIPSLVLQATAEFLGADLTVSEVQVGRAIFLHRKDGKLLRTIPIDNQGRMRIRYHIGPATSWQASFDNVMVYDDQLRNSIKPDRDLRDLSRRQIWVGRTDPGERERFNTPLGKISRVEIQLQAERTILDQDYIRPLPPMILALFYLLVSVGGATAMIRLGPMHATALLVMIASFWFEAAILAFRAYNVILPLPSFAMLLFGTYVMGLLAIFWDFEPENLRPQEN